ncbi:MAG: hypothetical protein P4M11_03650 [Candidatus Pacebacteria bacterium]|nr:hypothetical protein [Candidatus Paceibacterota bacterium]
MNSASVLWVFQKVTKVLSVYQFVEDANTFFILSCVYGATVVSVVAFCLCLLSLFTVFKRSVVEYFNFFVVDCLSHVCYIPLLGTVRP